MPGSPLRPRHGSACQRLPQRKGTDVDQLSSLPPRQLRSAMGDGLVQHGGEDALPDLRRPHPPECISRPQLRSRSGRRGHAIVPPLSSGAGFENCAPAVLRGAGSGEATTSSHLAAAALRVALMGKVLQVLSSTRDSLHALTFAVTHLWPACTQKSRRHAGSGSLM